MLKGLSVALLLLGFGIVFVVEGNFAGRLVGIAMLLGFAATSRTLVRRDYRR